MGSYGSSYDSLMGGFCMAVSCEERDGFFGC
jgi:hypothetical protein